MSTHNITVKLRDNSDDSQITREANIVKRIRRTNTSESGNAKGAY